MAAAARRFIILSAILLAVVIFTILSPSARATAAGQIARSAVIPNRAHQDVSAGSGLSGRVIAPKLGNETTKAELGRASWKLLHTMMAQFPDAPTVDESAALRDYIYLFQRLYPCGECAQHFGDILEEFPPQVSSRNVAAGWACHVHNEVNKSLKKEIFDCNNIGDFYDCGCADDHKAGS